ncbi:hypothetical protein IGI04_008414 [Brassica rapa subsp. trilocularis]|uniref:Jacalin-type lectin domain-containing protein n=1 Tax=Brassica rapa subsp. trilocularis TaxID=1813537 RepID=A0ABQ7NMQ7_BRACM|nr:hypothetical protein IGI04_008414 [Brassica rapa subsp. trilocularis]
MLSGRSDNRFQAHYNSSGMHSVVIFLRAADANKISETSTVSGSGYNKISDGSGFAKGNCGAGEGVREIYYNVIV